MRSKNGRIALGDILENIALAQSFSKGLTFSEFQADRRTVYAVTRCLEIISEATRRLSPEVKERHSDIDWIKIIASGNIYRHGYQVVRDEILWNTLKNSLEPLKTCCRGGNSPPRRRMMLRISGNDLP
jgi:uncharacterized protein with HEPN domain